MNSRPRLLFVDDEAGIANAEVLVFNTRNLPQQFEKDRITTLAAGRKNLVLRRVTS